MWTKNSDGLFKGIHTNTCTKKQHDAWRTHGDVVSDLMYCFYVSIVDLEQANAGYGVSKKDLT